MTGDPPRSFGDRDRPWLYTEIGGEPMPFTDTLDWAQHHEDAIQEGRIHVADTYITSHERVSTVFLGIDYNFMPDGPPILWETMIFGGLRDGEMWRYSDREEARLHHHEVVSSLLPLTREWWKQLWRDARDEFVGAVMWERIRARRLVDD